MNGCCLNRLTVVGPVAKFKTFREKACLEKELGARHAEVLEISATRLAWQFESDKPPLSAMKRLSSAHPRLTFLLDYDQEKHGLKGLARARKGKLIHHQVRY